ncbi:tRNA cyclic N6-threonylcarbamoyladenosine(37) synthase TcdA [Gynuella sunshinyii]
MTTDLNNKPTLMVSQHPEYLDRFGGTGRLYSAAGLQALANATVAVIGIGGVGSWVAEALARTGIGHLVLVDLDDICVTNTNRQIHALGGEIGKMKVASMASRIKAINPLCEVTTIEDFLTPENVATIVSRQWDFVVDAIDSVKPKAALINYCVRQKIPIITTGGAGGQIDPLKIQITDLSRTLQDPLAKKVRQILRKDYGFSRDPKKKFGVPCVFSMEALKYPQPDGSVCAVRSPSDSSTRLDCSGGFGAATMVTGTFGFVAAAHVVNKLTEK